MYVYIYIRHTHIYIYIYIRHTHIYIYIRHTHTYIYIHNYTYTYTIVYVLMIKSVAGLAETQVMRGRGWRRTPTASNTPKVNPETTRLWCFLEARLNHPKISHFYGWYKASINMGSYGWFLFALTTGESYWTPNWGRVAEHQWTWFKHITIWLFVT